jgi:NAD(P)-dependent dehydrogenase (short-subunit alcohol dehydrogenase family)
MIRSVSDCGKVLVTGGTSGLGLRLAKYFLDKGYDVVATGRKNITLTGYGERFSLLMTDFNNMDQTSEAMKKICRNHRFDIVINNAGILSPPDFQLTVNGLEYTFQVNFLSHLMLNEIILRNAAPGRSLMIASTVSPIYRIAEKDLSIYTGKSDYNPIKAYSNSKLYLALMCSYLPSKYPMTELRCIGFDPGIFSSEIYRMQKEWFRMLYWIAAPFMRSPEKVALRFGEVINREDLVNGAVYRTGKGKGSLPVAENQAVNAFWKECDKIIEPYVS